MYRDLRLLCFDTNYYVLCDTKISGILFWNFLCGLLSDAEGGIQQIPTGDQKKKEGLNSVFGWYHRKKYDILSKTEGK